MTHLWEGWYGNHKFIPSQSSRLDDENYNPIQKFRDHLESLMGEGFILLTRGYGFMGGVYHPPFDTLKNGTFTDDITLKLYR